MESTIEKLLNKDWKMEKEVSWMILMRKNRKKLVNEILQKKRRDKKNKNQRNGKTKRKRNMYI